MRLWIDVGVLGNRPVVPVVRHSAVSREHG
jgi:hypothetical protein